MSSHQSKLEQVLDLLINEEQEKAEALLHDIMVEKARSAYQDLVNEDFEEDEEFGGSPTEDFADEIEADEAGIEADEEEGDFVDDEEDFDDEGEEVEDRVEDLEAALADLRAEFDALLGDEEGGEDFEGGDEEEEFLDDGEGEDFEGGDEELDLEDEDDDDEEDGLKEATKLQNKVPDPGMKKEGEFSGTGQHSKKGATGTEAPYTRAPKRTATDGKETDFAGGDEKGEKAKKAKNHTPTDNINVKPSKAGGHAGKEEGKFSGTGKGSKAGAVNKDSALGHGKAPRGGKK